MLNKFEYNLDYYSGAQSSVYIENVLIDEITSLQWTVQQSKVPIYGYASQFFDEMASGTIIVQGSFSINFVEAGYLWSVLNHVRGYNLHPNNAVSILETQEERYKAKLQQLKTELSAVSDGIDLDPPTQEIAALMEKYAAQIAASREFGTPTNSGVLNDLIWGPETGTDQVSEELTDKRRVDRKALNGFDIYLKFGHEGSDSQTIHKIEGVHLTGKAQTLVIDENPVQEVYSFYAKNVI
jgi:hypothetical protein